MADNTESQIQSQIQSKVKDILATTPYAASSLKQLSGGTANFIYHAVLTNPPPESADGVIVKQGEPYVATNPSFALSTSRCAIEQQGLVYLEALPPVATSGACTVSTPKVFYYSPETFTQVQEYLPNAVSLKNYALEHYTAPTPESAKLQCHEIGNSLGIWLRSFHDWANESSRARLRDIAAQNKDMQQLKVLVNCGSLASVAEQHPDILGDVKDEIQQIKEMAEAEVKDDSVLDVIHGDFWTGNILLPNVPIEDGKHTPVKVIDWELLSLGLRPLDVGQMMAELWQLKLYRDIDAGEWLIKSFVGGYGSVDDTFAFRAILQIGVHLISFGSRTPGWGTQEQARDLVRTGKGVMIHAWKKDRDWFKGHVLECLFGQS